MIWALCAAAFMAPCVLSSVWGKPSLKNLDSEPNVGPDDDTVAPNDLKVSCAEVILPPAACKAPSTEANASVVVPSVSSSRRRPAVAVSARGLRKFHTATVDTRLSARLITATMIKRTPMIRLNMGMSLLVGDEGWMGQEASHVMRNT